MEIYTTIPCMEDSSFDVYAETQDEKSFTLHFVSGQGVTNALVDLRVEGISKLRQFLRTVENISACDPLDGDGIERRAREIVDSLLRDCNAEGVTDGIRTCMEIRVRGLIKACL